MGKVDRLRNRVEPFAALFWARHHFTAVHKACPYMVIVGSILNEDALAPNIQYTAPPPFLSRYRYCMLFIYAATT